MRVWSVNRVMVAVNLWRKGLTLHQIAVTMRVSPEEIPFDEMKKYGLEKL